MPASTRATVALPLVQAGIAHALPLLKPTPFDASELFDDPVWRERLVGGGVPEQDLPAVRQWLFAGAEAGSAATPQLALLSLTTLIEHLDYVGGAIRRLRLRRLGIGVGALAALAAAAGLVVLLLRPPEGPDLAVGKSWQASSAYPGYTASGTKPSSPKDGAFFCTNEDLEPWWKLDLKHATKVGGLTIVNRGDCCIERAPPLVVEVSADGEKWKEVARTSDAFRTWRPTFKATNARYVRLRSLRRTFLHLKDVRVHPPRP